MSEFRDIAEVLAGGGDPEAALARAVLRGAVMRQIMCPYSGRVLDIRDAVLLDGSDYARADGTGRGKMDIMIAEWFDILMAKFNGSKEDLEAALGYEVDIYDGRELFGGKKKEAGK